MGIILFPFFLGAIGIILKSIFMISAQYKENTFDPTNIIYGVLCMLLIYGLVVLSYSKEKKPWGLGPFFRFPLFMIYIPFLIAYLVRNFIELNFNQISTSLLICIIASGVFMTIFNGYVFNILEKLGKKKHY